MTAEQRAALGLLVTSAAACRDARLNTGAGYALIPPTWRAEVVDLISKILGTLPTVSLMPSGDECLDWSRRGSEVFHVFIGKEGN